MGFRLHIELPNVALPNVAVCKFEGKEHELEFMDKWTNAEYGRLLEVDDLGDFNADLIEFVREHKVELYNVHAIDEIIRLADKNKLRIFVAVY